MAAFALTALLLAVLGVTGVMNYTVARRTREMGLRLALGADPGEVRDLVLREGVRLAALGVGLGLVAALFLAGLLDDALLFEVGARDPGVYSGVALLLCFATAVACYVPASRASGVDPVSALTEV
jgi:ABC-type antimicrobial peptide transport system permease subunit